MRAVRELKKSNDILAASFLKEVIFMFKSKYFSAISLIIAILFQAGCSSIGSNFRCSPTNAITCSRLDQVNEMVNRGEIRAKPSSNSLITSDDLNNESFDNFPLAYHAAQPLRYGETVLRAWVAPFVDKEDVYHAQSMVSLIVKKGHWIGSPVKALSGNNE